VSAEAAKDLIDEIIDLGVDYKAAIHTAGAEANGNFLGYVSNLVRLNLSNAKKIHKFIKSLADEHLGKSFLVKLPQKSNINYQEEIKTNKTIADNGMVIKSGPFGFKPIAQSGKIIPNSGDIDFKNKFNYDFLFTEHKSGSEYKVEEFIKYNTSVNDVLLDVSGTYVGFEVDSGLTNIDVFDNKLALSGIFNYEPLLKGSGRLSPDCAATGIITDFEREVKYSVGSFKPRYNPTIDNWDFNYKPQTKGGYHDFSIFSELSASLLYPIDPVKLKTEENRISPYVIYNHSQLLHFKGGNTDSIIQESLGGDTTAGRSLIKRMDLCTVLDNVGTEETQLDKPMNSYTNERDRTDPDFNATQEHVAYVKCNVEEKVYFAPRFCQYKELPVAASEFKLLDIEPSALEFLTEDVIEGDDLDASPLPTGGSKIIGNFLNTAFVPKEPTDPLRKNIVSLEYVAKNTCDEYKHKLETHNLIIDTKASLNSEHIYALVKLSTRPVPMFDRRFSDGPLRSTNPLTVARIWNRDTIKGGGPWEGSLKKPAALTQGIEEEKLKFISAIDKGLNTTTNEEVIPLANPEILIDFVHPSPVIPNIIAIPLQSMQDCYGPWLSNGSIGNTSVSKGSCDQTFADIGGKVIYEKDENLSPWSFDGYENMNKAGDIQVAFSNSLMLFSEKGRFTAPGIPPEVYIGRPLFDNSPIVDSISVSVDGNGVKTTVSMEVFSKKFGKTEKQRQEQLSRITRERKIERQTRNKIIRSGAVVPDESKTLRTLIDSPDEGFSSFQTKKTVYDSVVASLVLQTQDVNVHSEESGVPPETKKITKTYNTVSFQKKGYADDVISTFSDVNDLNKALQKTGGALLNDIHFPFDESVYNPYMTNTPYVDVASITRRTS